MKKSVSPPWGPGMGRGDADGVLREKEFAIFAENGVILQINALKGETKTKRKDCGNEIRSQRILWFGKTGMPHRIIYCNVKLNEEKTRMLLET